MIFVTPVISAMSRAFAIPEVLQASVTQRISETPTTSSMSVALLTLKALMVLAILMISVIPAIFVTLVVYMELAVPPDSVIPKTSETLTISSTSTALATPKAPMVLVTRMI